MTAPLDNAISYDGQESESNTGAPDAGESYVVFIRETSGTATIAPDHGVAKRKQSLRSERQESRLPQTVSSAGRQARARVRNHAVTNSLGACVTLTYRDLTDDPAKDLSKFIRDVRRFYPESMHWVSVTEGQSGDSEHRLHHHVLLPLCNNMHKVASQWPHGDIHVGINLSDSSIRCAANYVSKDFFRDEGDAPRYRISRGGKTHRRVVHAGTLDEAIDVALSYVPAEIDTYISNSPGIGGRITLYWETDTPELGELF
jgi:hypothetical protein